MGTLDTVELSLLLQRVTEAIGAKPTPSPKPAPSGAPPSSDPFDLLPLTASVDESQVQINLPEQFVTQATILGSGVAPDGQSGYVALDPGTGELLFVHFVCAELTIAAAPVEAPPSSEPSPSTKPSAVPTSKPSPAASPKATTSATPAGSPGASPAGTP